MNLEKILEDHKAWMKDPAKGGRASLSDAYLSGADLSGANLSGANLSGAIGNGREIKSLQMEYFITYTHDRLQIGCQNHPVEHWWTLSADDVEEMEGGAGELWEKWKPILKTVIETSPARKP